jgi:hypothetical protein
MSQIDKKLRSNPFLTYRDPVSGRWIVVRADRPRLV